ncbi:MAG: nicotinate-nucleotide adenylyltransferase [Acidiferrobacterales bacterium]
MIGILGGTFDPIHYGHLRPALEVLGALGLDEVRFVPAGMPPHRTVPSASSQHRFRMVELAVANRPGLCADDREARMEGPSYTVRTLESLRGEIGSRALCLLMGTDAFRGIESWYRWERLLQLAHIVVMERPGSQMSGMHAQPPSWARDHVCQDKRELSRTAAGRILFQHVEPQAISASAIRTMIAQAQSVEELLPAEVWQYIRTHRLYGYKYEGA